MEWRQNPQSYRTLRLVLYLYSERSSNRIEEKAVGHHITLDCELAPEIDEMEVRADALKLYWILSTQ